MGDRFPGWFINLSTLVDLKFTDCKRCRELPALGQLPSLERLELRGLENIRSIGLSFYGISSGGGGQVRTFFPALKYLRLFDMVNLVEWKDEDEVKSTTGAAKVDLFPVLEKLLVGNCSRLTSAPSHFRSIEGLGIRDSCHVSLLKMIVNGITSLSSLVLIGNMPDEDDSHRDEHISRLVLMKQRHSKNLEGEVEYTLHVEGCGSLSKMLEHLCHLPSFRYLVLGEFSNLTRLMGQESFFTSIEELTISRCSRLTSLPGEMLESCASLKKLKIFDCLGLTSLPGEMLESCASLQELEISGCHELTSLPGEMLESCASLRILKVSYCSNLVSFPHDLRKTPSLEILDLSRCPEVMIADMSKGFGFLTSLRELEIGPFSSNETNEEFDWSGLISSFSSPLTSLRVYGWPHVESLPEQLQYLTSLTEFHLNDFGIEALPDWIGKLASLERLELWNCQKLRYLPSMAVRRCLTKFTSLKIYDCPVLEERCKSGTSGTNSEWPIILQEWHQF